MTRKDIDQFFTILSQKNPHPTTELEYKNPYTLLVAVVLSAQSTDVGVNKATAKLFETVQTPEAMLELGEEALKSHIKTIGLYNTKAKNIMKLSQQLIDTYNSEVPQNREALESLAGVGRKTANVVLNTVFGQETIAVDTHVFRVANRTGITKAKTVEETEAQLMKRIAGKWLQHAHHWLILHGRYICKAPKPKCAICPVMICATMIKRQLNGDG